jgi:hypothetical protein
MSWGSCVDEGEWTLSDVQESQRYMVGDIIRVELDLEHRTNLSRVFVAFTNQTDPLTEFYFEAMPLPEAAADGRGED